jgi:hypothetical protein
MSVAVADATTGAALGAYELDGQAPGSTQLLAEHSRVRGTSATRPRRGGQRVGDSAEF